MANNETLSARRLAAMSRIPTATVARACRALGIRPPGPADNSPQRLAAQDQVRVLEFWAAENTARALRAANESARVTRLIADLALLTGRRDFAAAAEEAAAEAAANVRNVGTDRPHRTDASSRMAALLTGRPAPAGATTATAESGHPSKLQIFDAMTEDSRARYRAEFGKQLTAEAKAAHRSL
jgi:hypothetical protein